MEFPVYIVIGDFRIHPHLLFDLLAYSVGFQLFLRLRRRAGDPLDGTQRAWIVMAAILGALAGSKLLAWLIDPAATWAGRGDVSTWLAGKTVLGGLLGGTLAVEGTKRILGVQSRTGDLFALPLAVGIAIGRIGCFLSGLPDRTYGTPTGMPWGVDFGDGIARHPTQLYEIAFLLALALLLVHRARLGVAEGHLFRLFLLGYLAWRFLVTFVQPFPTFAGLATLQWASLAGLAFYARSIPDLIRPRVRTPQPVPS